MRYSVDVSIEIEADDEDTATQIVCSLLDARLNLRWVYLDTIGENE